MRWCGKVGYEILVETSPDVWTPTIVERTYYGDTDRMIDHIQNGDGINDNLQLNMQVKTKIRQLLIVLVRLIYSLR